jgi:outer membrane lipoprotein-sorting protein
MTLFGVFEMFVETTITLRVPMKRVLLASSLIIVAAAQLSSAQTPTAAEILHNMKNQFDLVKDYTATLKVAVDMERMQIPEMVVTMYFKQPDKIYIEAKNFAMVPREIVGLNPAQLIDKYDATVAGSERKENTTVYKLRMLSKPEKGKPVRESYIWVDGARWVVTHYESTPSDVRKVTVDLEYATVEGKYTLPSKIEARMDSQQPADSSAEKMYGPQRLPRKGTASIVYSDYKVNTGLSDEIFQKKEENGKR